MRWRWMLGSLALCAVLLLWALGAGPASSAAVGKRVALVIGNANYQYAPPLKAPLVDARRWTTALKGAGFEVESCLDCTRQQMVDHAQRLEKRIAQGDEALLYYSGHGAERDGVNLLFPVDFANTVGAGSAQQQAVHLGFMVERMAGARIRVVVLDACRNWPFDDGVKTLGYPLFVAEQTSAAGTLVAYATRFGAYAVDTSSGSPYSDEVLRLAFQPGKPLLLALTEAAEKVQARTGGVQVPWISGSLAGGAYVLVPEASAESAWGAVAAMPDGPAKKEAAMGFVAKYGQSGSPLVGVAWNLLLEQGGGATTSSPPLGKLGDPPAGGPTGRTYAARKGTAGEMSFIGLSEGVFDMGSPDDIGESSEHPQRRVRVSAFAMGQSEVTQAQWAAVVAAGQKVKDTDATGLKADPSGFKGAQRPVEQVSWCDAARFANVLSRLEGRKHAYTVRSECEQGGEVTWDRSSDGYRLPTEAEWEYAARAGTRSAYSFGDDPDQLCRFANVFDQSGKTGDPDYFWTSAACDDGHAETAPVCTYSKSPWGLCDVHGNVWEWTWDWYKDSYDVADVGNPAGAARGVDRVLRGGSWYGTLGSARSAYRNGNRPSVAGRGGGFRLVLPVSASDL